MCSSRSGPYSGSARSARPVRALAIAAVGVLAASALTACGSDGPGRGDTDALQIWVYQDGSTVIQETFVERFNENSDIRAELVQIPGENYQERMRTAMGTPNAPDVFFNWGGGSISDFVAEDMLVDLTDTLAEDPGFAETFLPSVLEAGAVNGRVYGIPMRGVQPVVLFYNRTLFAEAGLEPPQTWADFQTAVETFTAEDTTPVVLAGGDSWTELMWLEYLLDRFGGAQVFRDIRNGEGQGWDHPAVLQAAEAVRELVDSGAFGRNFLSVKYTNDGASSFFAQGEAAMHLMGSWEYANQLTNQPDFAARDLAWTAFPAIEDGQGDPASVVGNPTNYWSVNSDVEGERLEAAIEFLKLHGTESYAQALVDNGDIPPTADTVELLARGENSEMGRFGYELVSQAPDFTLSWDQALPAGRAKPMMDAIEKLFAGQLSPQEFVDTLRKNS